MKHMRRFHKLIIFVISIFCLTPALAQEGIVSAAGTESTRLVAADASVQANFGNAIAVDGDTAVIGAPNALVDGERRGAAYVFMRAGGSWSQVAQLTASDGEAGDLFGASVAIDDGTIVVGAAADDDAGGNAGAAYVFTGAGSDWIEAAKLLPSVAGDARFGFTVAVSGSYIAVGAPFTDSGMTNSGAAYVFEADGEAWTQAVRLATGGGGAVLSDLFGWAVAVRGNLLVVGAYLDDRAFLYNRSDTGWNAAGSIRGDDTSSGDRFGYSVATDGARIIVGATHNDEAGNNAGAAYVFTTGGAQEAKLLPTATTPLNGANAGWSVAIAGGNAVFGAPNSNGVVDEDEAGSAFAYRLDGGTWQAAGVLTASDATASDNLGIAVGISEEEALVGAPRSGGTGAVYVIPFSGATLNSPPTAADDSVTTPVNTAVTIAVLANDSDPDGDPLTIIEITMPANGTAEINDDDTITYTPNDGFVGMDRFDYAISDGRGGVSSARVNVRVVDPSAPPPENRPPTAGNDAAATTINTAVTINVLANDSDPDGDPLTVTSVTAPANGTVVNNGNGTVTYTPNTGFVGVDTFSYTISDGQGGTASATVTVTVSDPSAPPENRPPVAVNDTASTSANTAVTINVLANDSDPDGDPLTVTSVTAPANGTVVNNGNGTVTYTPNTGFVGVDTFSYTISDGQGGTASATVTVTVNAVTTQPVPPVSPPPAPPGNTIVDAIIAANTGSFAGQFDTLIAALGVADPSVFNTLNGSGQHTLFAPTDTAFANRGITPETVGALDPAALTNILLYHVASGRRDSSIVLAADRINMLNGGFVFQSGGVLTDNQRETATITAVDLSAANGIIHVIDAVLNP